jgi:short-subunit dehydrogenase
MHILITGASSGLGADFARIAAKAGHTLLLTGRNELALSTLAAELAPSEVHLFVADLAASGGVDRLLSAIHDRGFHVDALINNAGFGDRARISEMDIKVQLDMIQVNITSLVELTHRLLPQMRRSALKGIQGAGVMNVASTAAFQAGPFMSTYYATKAFVLSWTEGLAVEEPELRVMALCPGPTLTDFAARAKMQDTKVFQSGAMRSQDVVQKAWADWQWGTKSRVVSIPGFRNKLGAFLVRLAPRALTRFVVSALQRP